MSAKVSLLLAALLFSIQAHSLEWQETFSTRGQLDSSSAVWNQALGKIHPSLRVMNFKSGFTPLDFGVGDGSDGAFEPATYAQFSQNGDVTGQIIRLDTSLHPTLQVTRFELAAGWVLEPIGAAPLVIESLSDVIIEGEIRCQGANGTNSSGTTPGLGGIGRCGGTDGGDGGAATQNGGSANDPDTLVTGGNGGEALATSYVGGGGGGSWSSTSLPQNGVNGSGTSGRKGDSHSDPEFLYKLGSGGGGGGSGSDTTAGAGGGGGGGVVIIHAVGDLNFGSLTNSTTGFIYVNGGDGGNANTLAGPGGGGGGGSVQIFVGGAINIYNTDAMGASQANGGLGGTNSGFAAGASGGLGRSWLSSVTYNGVGYYTPAEEAPVTSGNVEFNSASQSVIFKSFDLMNTLAQINTVTISPNSADFSYTMAGSDDDFHSDDTGWTSDLARVAKKRYVRLKLTVTTSNVNTPTMVDTVNFQYSLGQKEDFKFEAAGCGRMGRGPGHPPSWPNGFAILTVFGFLQLLKLKAQRQLSRRRESTSTIS